MYTAFVTACFLVVLTFTFHSIFSELFRDSERLLYLDRVKKEHFTTLYPFETSDTLSMVSNRFTFPMENEHKKLREKETTTQTTYTVDDMTRILKPLAKTTVYNESDFVEVLSTDVDKITRPLEREDLDDMLTMFQNAIHHDLFKNKSRLSYVMCPNVNECGVELASEPKLVRVRVSTDGKRIRWDYWLEMMIQNKSDIYGILCVLESPVTNVGKVQPELIGLRIAGTMPQESHTRYFKDLYSYESVLKGDDLRYADYPAIGSTPADVLKPLTDAERESMAKEYVANAVEPSSYFIIDKSECVGSTGRNKLECESSYDMKYQPKPRGVWDKPCVRDSECPFYRKNETYDNKFGGCVLGKCEMPVGIKRLGHRYYDIDSVPKCHGCPKSFRGGQGECCNLQAKPNYAFERDTYVRKVRDDEGL